MSQVIDRFEGKYGFLSNFYPHPVKMRGVEYPTNEHAFQAAKTLDPKQRLFIRDAPTPSKAKYWGRALQLRSDWERIKVEVMLGLCRLKFKHDPLRSLLLETGDAELIEGNTWGDTFWGVSAGQGRNELGKILMQVRAELRQATPQEPDLLTTE